MTRTKSLLRRLGSDTRGTSAAEFALVAPFVFFGLLSMVDLGLVFEQRINMDQVVRAGAESAMLNSDEDDIRAVLESTAAKTFKLSGGDDNGTTYQGQADHPISFVVDRFCECPDSPGTEVGCSDSCGDDPPNVFVQLSAAKQHPGMLLPTFNLNSEMRVQLR